jgi:hypothetical protein
VKANAAGWGQGMVSEAEFSEYDDDETLEQLSTVFKGC